MNKLAQGTKAALFSKTNYLSSLHSFEITVCVVKSGLKCPTNTVCVNINIG